MRAAWQLPNHLSRAVVAMAAHAVLLLAIAPASVWQHAAARELKDGTIRD